MRDRYYPTGNEFVALPTINKFGEIESFNVLSMADRGLLEVTGKPFLRLEFEIDGQTADMSQLDWEMLDHWIPSFKIRHGETEIMVSYVTPLDTRGWFLDIKLSCPKPQEVLVRLHGDFSQLLHSVNETKPCRGEIFSYQSLWNQGYMFDFRTAVTKLSFGFLTSGEFDHQAIGEHPGKFTLTKDLRSGSEENETVTNHEIFMGVGLEEVGAATQAVHMQRQGGDILLRQLRDWLSARIRTVGEKRIDEILNQNQFFNFFYATGKTLDSEETILCTSRSPRYYVSAAYWDRDSLIWSFPALLVTEPPKAKEALDYVFGRQIRNIGIHSRYIDGTLLEPGFELDELCAPILALGRYFDETGDWQYLNSPAIISGIDHIIYRLREWKHPNVDLYGTFLMPTDDMRRYPYLTYNNVLVWKALTILKTLFLRLGNTAQSLWAKERAKLVHAAIERHCVKNVDGKPQYIWSTDLEGNFDVYDEPPGSLTLLAYYGFCSSQAPAFKNTLQALYSKKFPHYFAGSNFEELGCTHAEHPWILSICNSLLNGRRDYALDMLKRTGMDNLIACESINAQTGECETGAHFATCAGFLVHALLSSADGNTA